MHAEQTIPKSQLHIKLHYTWGHDTGEKTSTNFGPYTYRRKQCWVGACNFFFSWNRSCNTESVCCSPCNILQHSTCYFQCIDPFPSERTHCTCRRLQYRYATKYWQNKRIGKLHVQIQSPLSYEQHSPSAKCTNWPCLVQCAHSSIQYVCLRHILVWSRYNWYCTWIMTYTSNLLQTHISMFQSIYVSLISTHIFLVRIQTVFYSNYKIYIVKKKKVHPPKNYLWLYSSYSISFLYMYIVVAFFLTSELMFISVFLCTFVHRNRQEKQRMLSTPTHTHRPNHAKVHHFLARVPQ